MLFNSSEFLFVFLPVALSGFYLLGARSRTSAIRWLILVSLAFYAWWRPVNVLIIGPSILINFALASILLRLNQGEGSRRMSTAVLVLGICFNVAFLGFFKYTDFIFGSINDILGANLVLRHIILPLGISFHYFSKDRVADRHSGWTGKIAHVPGLLHFRPVLSPAYRRSDCTLSRNDASVSRCLVPF